MKTIIEKENLEGKGPKHIEKEDPKRHPEERGLKPVREERREKRLHSEGPKPKHPEHEIIDSKEHMLPAQEELEVMINLCGSKKELIDVLNHINRMIVEAPKKVDCEIKAKKRK